MKNPLTPDETVAWLRQIAYVVSKPLPDLRERLDQNGREQVSAAVLAYISHRTRLWHAEREKLTKEHGPNSPAEKARQQWFESEMRSIESAARRIFEMIEAARIGAGGTP